MTTKEAVDLGLTGNEAQVVAACTAEAAREFEKTRDAIVRYRDGTEQRIKSIEDDLKAFGLKMRPDGSIGGGSHKGAPRSEPLLSSDTKFAQWLAGPGPRSRKSSFQTDMPFRMQTKNTITGVSGTTYDPIIRGPQQPALRLVELLPDVPVALGAAVAYTRETAFTPAAGIQAAQGDLKPASTLTFTNELATVETIATTVKASLQSLSDTPGLQLWIDRRLQYAVALKAEDVFLNDGTNGLMALASALTLAYTPPTGSTVLDYIGGAIGQLQAAGYTPDGVVMSGVDSNAMRLTKSTTGEYVWANPDGAIGTTAVWGVPMVISPSLAAGQFLVGAFAESTILFERQQILVEVAYENEDDFVRNLCTMRGEQRCALAVPVPAGLVKGTVPAPAPGAAAAGPFPAPAPAPKK